jgi:hypothetical protein
VELDGFDGRVAGEVVYLLGGGEGARLEVVHEGAEAGGEGVAVGFGEGGEGGGGGGGFGFGWGGLFG